MCRFVADYTGIDKFAKLVIGVKQAILSVGPEVDVFDFDDPTLHAVHEEINKLVYDTLPYLVKPDSTVDGWLPGTDAVSIRDGRRALIAPPAVWQKLQAEHCATFGIEQPQADQGGAAAGSVRSGAVPTGDNNLNDMFKNILAAVRQIENYVKVMRRSGQLAAPPKRPRASRYGGKKRPNAGAASAFAAAVRQYGAPTVVSAPGGIESDVDVSAYAVSTSRMTVSDGDGDNVLAELHKITENGCTMWGGAQVCLSHRHPCAHPTQATVAVHGATASASRPAGQVVPATGGAWSGRDSPDAQDEVLNQVAKAEWEEPPGFGHMTSIRPSTEEFPSGVDLLSVWGAFAQLFFVGACSFAPAEESFVVPEEELLPDCGIICGSPCWLCFGGTLSSGGGLWCSSVRASATFYFACMHVCSESSASAL
ncbi:hypothetical protein CYMTET_21277 [Cymbomonas tetramitiformis]|uniref:Uncharacterized protein n=1 Tax=Cymbomonas tetramitiformis TaxID=36881 RepID=A0AAE0L3E8_9CHLO|nr:hypothetical protein CYMTET_21277 [Cymbomonas tetramitiformis]